jgi:hypothetical protein
VISAAESSERSFPAQHTNVRITQRSAGAKVQAVVALMIANGLEPTLVYPAAKVRKEPLASAIRFLY